MEKSYYHYCRECREFFRIPESSVTERIAPVTSGKQRCDGKWLAEQCPLTYLICCPNCGKEYVLEPPYIKDALLSEDDIDLHPVELLRREISVGLRKYYHGTSKIPDDLSQIPICRPLNCRGLLGLCEKAEPKVHRQRNYLRKTWHCLNDLRQFNLGFLIEKEYRIFLERLIDESPWSGEEKALNSSELCRELGRFTEAKKLLGRKFNFKWVPRAEQLMRAIDAESTEIFELLPDDAMDFVGAWRSRGYEVWLPTKKYEPPPEFIIGNRNWWVKTLGMLSRNWALVECVSEGPSVVYFFNDSADYELIEYDPTRYTTILVDMPIIDHLDFESLSAAIKQLRKNGFIPVEESSWGNELPMGKIYDARKPGKGVYSQDGYWIFE